MAIIVATSLGVRLMRFRAVLTIAACLLTTLPAAASDVTALGLKPAIEPDGEATGAVVRLSPQTTLLFSAETVEPDGWVDRSDEGATAFTARLRASYQATPGVSPFVEMEVFRRAPLAMADGSLAMPAYAWRAGVAVKGDISGEIAAGYIAAPDGGQGLGGFAIDGSLAWAPTPLTTVGVNLSTALAGSDDPMLSPGSVVYDGSVGLTFAWLGDIDLTGMAGFRHEEHRGTNVIDTRYRAGVSATWAANGAEFSAGYHHEWRDSSDLAGATESDAMRVELTVRR